MVDPLWAILAEGWWAVPASIGAVGAGALGWWGMRAQRDGKARRLELDAAKHALGAGRQAVTRARADVHAARAGVARADAERLAGRASPADVATARHELAQAQRVQSAATADLVARRADVRAARASVPNRDAGPDALPLARLMATHDTITAEWMSYETDPAKAISYPSMSDAREPLTAVFLRERQQAQWLRPTSSAAAAPRQKPISPADYGAYRDAVRRMSRAFAAAERDAWRRAGEARGNEPRSEWWASLAQDVTENARRSAEAIARAAASMPWSRRRDDQRD